MDIPRENILAAFPPSRTAGNVTLRPLTLGGVIRLAQRGVSIDGRIPRDKVVETAFVLSGGDDFKRFCKRAKCGLKELCNAVETVLNDAFETFVKPRAESDGVEHLTPHGLGWPLEDAEWLCAEYGWRWGEALETPVATVHALAAACRQRHGGRHGGFDYLERKYREDVKAGRVRPFTLDDLGGKVV